MWSQHAFVNQRAAAQTWRIPKGVDLGHTDGHVRHFTNDVEFALKGHLIGEGWTASDENLAHERLAGLG